MNKCFLKLASFLVIFLSSIAHAQSTSIPSCEQGAKRLLSDISAQGIFNWVYANDPTNPIGIYIWKEAKATVKTWKQNLLKVQEIRKDTRSTKCVLLLETIPEKEEGKKFVKNLIENKELAPGLHRMINHPTIQETFVFFVCGFILTMHYDAFYDANGKVDIKEEKSSEQTKTQC